jgi:NAD(H)-dependent 7beta-hydroxy-3-oxo-delta4-cholenoic acid oxidoreductase
MDISKSIGLLATKQERLNPSCKSYYKRVIKMNEIKELLQPLKIGSMTVKNRVFMSPMMVGQESEDGRISPNMVRYWAERAKGGVGCIITEMMSADPNMAYGGGGTGSTMNFGNSEIIDSYRAFVNEIHSYGTKIIPQISIPGPDATGIDSPPAPSVYINANGVKTRALDKKELPAIVQSFARMARQAKELGFDGIELHAAHAYMLLGSFLSPLRNKRTDEYGGNVLGRARLLIETLKAIKKEAGQDFPIIIRMSGDERTPGGNTLHDMLFLAPYLVEAGADGFEVSGATFPETPNKTMPCLGDEPQGINTPESSALKSAANVPVLVVGKIQDPRFAEYVVASGKADAVVVGRALLSDPEWLNKGIQGHFDDIAPCTGCAVGCIQPFLSGGTASCVINPAAGREEEFKISPAPKEKKVVVVGGGMAGMAAAHTAAKRGHKVVLLEKSSELGGQIKLGCRPPFKQPLSKWIIYYAGQLEKTGVTIKLGIQADEQSIVAENPDSVIVATGARNIKPSFPGVDGQNVYQAWDVILNNPPIITGNVVIIGGGSVGLETADLLLEQARGPLRITIVEMLSEVGIDLFLFNKMTIMKHLLEAGAVIQTNTKVTEIQADKVCCEKNGQPLCIQDVTHVVLACGSQSENAFYESIKQKFPEIFLVGDAEKPGRAVKAVEDGTRVALSI